MSEDYIDKWTVASFLLAFWAVVGFFVYLMHNGLVKSPMDYILLIGLPIGILPLFAFLLSSEISGCKKFKRSREVCLKRFIGRAFLYLGLLSVFYLSLIASILAGLLNTGGSLASIIFVSMIILVGWSALIFVIQTKLREAVRKLTEGLW
jgi:hypothetical protein